MSKFSPAREKTESVVALYREGFGHKTIAGRLCISPRIAREILIEEGEWKPDPKRNGVERKGQGPWSRVQTPAHLHAAMVKVTARCAGRQAALHEAMQRVVERKPSPTAGMTNAQAFKWKYRNIPEFRLHQLIRRRMRKIMTGESTPSRRQVALIGCSPKQFREHIERQFINGMGWHNNGTGPGKWHLDHITPCKGMDTGNEWHMRALWHWTNFRPLWSKANMTKNAKINHLNDQLGLPL